MRALKHCGVLVGAILAVCGAAGASYPATGTAATEPDKGQVASIPVEFHVVTSNRSGVPCSAVGADQHVVVRGHLTGPAEVLSHRSVDGVVYSHGDGYGEYFWRYTDDAGYNYVAETARRGHVSVSIDRLGYGASDKPDGNGVCLGTEADVLHQIIGQLRAGSYRGKTTPSFHRVGLVGHSASGFVVEQEAAAFSDVDALGVISSGELNATPQVARRSVEQQIRCVNARNGYAPLEADDAQFQSDHIYNTEPGPARALTARRTEDACAGTRNAAQTMAANTARNGKIRVPVLVMVGANDAFFADPRHQAGTYASSPRVTVRTLPNTGHAIAFGRTAPQFRYELERWLAANRL